ncbi:MAG: putative universal stress protein [Acidobacteria bacterium]|nr:putative universal stress protein [Acidobacteriota bacterium]
MITLRKVLVATDFSAPSIAALSYGRELARSFGATLTVVHVVDDIVMRAYGVDSGVLVTDPAVQRQFEADALTQVTAAISDDDRTHLAAEGVVLVASAPSAAIVGYAHESRTDLIVMGTHGRGGFAHLLMGSVSERAVQSAPCPVLTVRHPEHAFVHPDALVAVAKA